LSNFTPITGQDLVQRIEELAASEVEQAQKEVWATAESAIQNQFRQRGLELSAHETLQVLRKFDVNISAKPMTVKIMESIWQALDGLRGDVPASEMPEFATFLKNEYFNAKKAESSKRVLLTHVNAALRCFRRRYVSSWQSFYGDVFDVLKFAKDVDVLNEQIVSNPDDLIEWAKDVVDLSNRYGVDRENRLKVSRENRMVSRPAGVISVTSEGPYSRQWTAWIGANADRLLTGWTKTSYPLNRDFMFKAHASDPVTVEVKRHFKTQDAVTLEVSSLIDSTIQGKTQWSDLARAETTVAGWISLLEVVWGAAAAKITATLTVQTESLNFSIDVPGGSLSEVTSTIEETLGRLVATQPAKTSD
jgi:hypothetical protein